MADTCRSHDDRTPLIFQRGQLSKCRDFWGTYVRISLMCAGKLLNILTKTIIFFKTFQPLELVFRGCSQYFFIAAATPFKNYFESQSK